MSNENCLKECIQRAACAGLGKPTGHIDLIMNQGGIRNKIPRELKEALVAELDKCFPGRRRKMKGLSCDVAHGKLGTVRFIKSQAK